jgi:hypothetical protein
MFCRLCAMEESDEIIFQPEYRRRLWGSWMALSAIVLTLFFSASFTGEEWFDLRWLLTLPLLALPLALTKEIRFGKHITIKRYLLPARTFAYDDVRSLSTLGLHLRHDSASKSRRDGVAWVGMKNADELVRILRGLVDRGVIPSEQLEDFTLRYR